MPIYEYVCKDCGEHFEVVRLIKDADSTIACKKCSGTHTSRAISVFYAQSSGRVVAGGNGGGCAGCTGGSCSSCGH